MNDMTPTNPTDSSISLEQELRCAASLKEPDEILQRRVPGHVPLFATKEPVIDSPPDGLPTPTERDKSLACSMLAQVISWTEETEQVRGMMETFAKAIAAHRARAVARAESRNKELEAEVVRLGGQNDNLQCRLTTLVEWMCDPSTLLNDDPGELMADIAGRVPAIRKLLDRIRKEDAERDAQVAALTQDLASANNYIECCENEMCSDQLRVAALRTQQAQQKDGR